MLYFALFKGLFSINLKKNRLSCLLLGTCCLTFFCLFLKQKTPNEFNQFSWDFVKMGISTKDSSNVFLLSFQHDKMSLYIAKPKKNHVNKETKHKYKS